MPSRTLTVTAPYLLLPVANGAPMRHLRCLVQGQWVRAFDIELADGRPDFWVSCNLRPWMGQAVTVEAPPNAPPAALDALHMGATLPDGGDLYQEPYRPQCHFTSRRGWNNDPNGLMFHDGVYHLFYQHNPYGVGHGNMHWGHATSPDLVHWTEQDDALYPDRLGTCFSGSGVVDVDNTAGLQTSDDPTLCCIYTAAGGRAPESAGQPFTQALAYSTDGGDAWRTYADNPIIGHIIAHNRDPKVIWHEPTNRWVMVLYLDGNQYGLFTSPNLIDWQQRQTIVLPDATECPDLFPLAVDDDPQDVRWVWWGANGTYLLGDFDGQTFVPQGEPLRYDWGGHSYAAQTWSNVPDDDGRRIQIAWLRRPDRTPLPDTPFNQCMTFPCELTLRATADGVRLFSQPVRELMALHDDTCCWGNMTLLPGDNPLEAVEGECFHLQATLAPAANGRLRFDLRGVPLTYDAAWGELRCLDTVVPVALIDGRLALEILIDRTSIEIFANGGEVALPLWTLLADGPPTLGLAAERAPLQIENLTVHTLRAAWS